jgi:hypothetical protein
VLDEDLIDPFHIDVQAVVLSVQIELGVVATLCRDALVAQNLGHNRFAEEAAELNCVVEGNSPQTQETLVVGELIKLDQEAAFVLLSRRR